MSTTKLAPDVSGPHAQILRASLSSHSNFSFMILVRSFISALGPQGPSSISLDNSSTIGWATKYRRLCLLGDLARQVCEDSTVTVSRYATTGSLMTKSHCAYSSLKSFRQISTWSSPHPAMMCSPLSSVVQITRGSDFESFFKPSTSLGRSLPSFGLTATFTTGDTLYFIAVMLCASSMSVMVPDLRMYWSTPTNATVLPQGTSAICSMVLPIMRTVRWMFLMFKSSLPPGL